MTAAPQPNLPDRVWRRAGVTVAALVAAWLLGQLRIPGWRPGFYDPGALALGLAPIISGFVLVELAALAVPPWDALRHAGPAARAKLALAAHAVAATLAALQAFEVVRYATNAGALEDAAAPRAAAIATLAVGPFLLAALARWVDGRGLTNGFALLVGWTAGSELWETFSAAVSGPAVGPGAFALAAGAGGIAVSTWLVARTVVRDVAPPGAEAPRIPALACGLAPLAVPAAALLVPATLTAWWPGLQPAAEALRPGSNGFHAAEAVLALLLVAALGVAFNRSGALGRVWAALPPVPRGADLVVLARSVRRRAIGRSALVVAAVLAVVYLVRSATAGELLVQRAVVAAVVVVAVAIDLVVEARFRSGTEAQWTAVWPLHRAFEPRPVLERLVAAGIPAFVRGQVFRRLYQFFAPYAPLVVFVPRERAEEATAILRAVFEPGANDQIGGRARSP